jgi:site-specific recombinase XerD
MTSLAPILEGFFTDYLMTQRQASPHTIASYRDTFTLLLGHLRNQTGKLPSHVDLTDLDAPAITGFLHHLETNRGNDIATRNARLTAIHDRSMTSAAIYARVSSARGEERRDDRLADGGAARARRAAGS